MHFAATVKIFKDLTTKLAQRQFQAAELHQQMQKHWILEVTFNEALCQKYMMQ